MAYGILILIKVLLFGLQVKEVRSFVCTFLLKLHELESLRADLCSFVHTLQSSWNVYGIPFVIYHEYLTFIIKFVLFRSFLPLLSFLLLHPLSTFILQVVFTFILFSITFFQLFLIWVFRWIFHALDLHIVFIIFRLLFITLVNLQLFQIVQNKDQMGLKAFVNGAQILSCLLIRLNHITFWNCSQDSQLFP